MNKRKQIKLMADYHSWPLWDPENVRNVDPEKLPLSPELVEKLNNWAKLYNQNLSENDPASSGFKSEQDAFAFDRQGRELQHALQKELGDDYIVTYFNSI